MADRYRVDNLESGEFVVVNARDIDLAVEVCVCDTCIVPDDAAIGSPIHESDTRGPRNSVGDSVAKRDRIVKRSRGNLGRCDQFAPKAPLQMEKCGPVPGGIS